MDKNKNMNYSLSKTINNFHYRIAIKTTLNDEFIILYSFLLPKQHQTINLSFCGPTQSKVQMFLYFSITIKHSSEWLLPHSKV